MQFLLGSLCGLFLGLIVATAWSVSAQSSLDQYLQRQHERQERDLYLDLREAEMASRLRSHEPAYDPCRK